MSCGVGLKKEFNSNHALELLNKLNVQRKSSSAYCDITIRGGERDFPAHKCIVGAFSDFFGKMFTSEMREKYETSATVVGVSAEIMDLLIDFIYTCKITITEENVFDILAAGDYMQIPNIKDYCSSFLLDNVNARNCLRIRKCAQTYKFDKVLLKCEKRVQKEFSAVSMQAEFKQLEIEDISLFLQMKNLNISSEEVIFNAVTNWVQHDMTNREVYFQLLFGFVKLEDLAREFIENVVLREDLVMDSRECTSLLIKALATFLPLKVDQKSQFLFFGGEKHHMEILKYLVEEDEWLAMPKLQTKLIAGSEGSVACMYKEQVYLMGGGQGFFNEATRTVRKLKISDPNSNCMDVAPMQDKRQYAASAIFNEYVYVVGGYDGSRYLSCTEAFDLEEQIWSKVATKMKKGRSCHAVVLLHDLIYAIGGFNGGGLSSVECFYPSTETWTEISRLKKARWGLAAVVLNDEIYAVGGFDSATDRYLRSVEKFGFQSTNWGEVAPLMIPRFGANAFVHDRRIFVIGGRNKDGPVLCNEVYDPQTNKWTLLSAMKNGRVFSAMVQM